MIQEWGTAIIAAQEAWDAAAEAENDGEGEEKDLEEEGG